MMDNASIHCSERIQQLVFDAGHRIEYLPLYSPDFNLIELAFRTLKAWIRRYREMATNFKDFGAFLEFAMSIEQGRNARAQFKHCGYTV